MRKLFKATINTNLDTVIKLQTIALVLAAFAAVLCCIVDAKPEWVGITNLGEIRAIPTAALVGSVGFVAIDIFYLVMLVRAKTPNSTKAAVIISALLLCVLAVVVEPTVYTLESRQLQLQELQVGDAAKVIALISAKRSMRELVRLILFVSGALSFLSMGSFWGKYANKAEQSESISSGNPIITVQNTGEYKWVGFFRIFILKKQRNWMLTLFSLS